MMRIWLTLVALLVATPAFAVCDLETLNFYTKEGARQPVPRSSGCTKQLSAAAGAVDSTTIPLGANYILASYQGDGRLVLDSTKNKFGATAPQGHQEDGGWPMKPTFRMLDAVSGTVLSTVKLYGVTAVSSTLEFYK